MSALDLLRPVEITDIPANHFVVVHPLDDIPEEKIDTSALGAMPMTASVRFSLMALRGYLVLMMFLVLYHVMDIAGVFGKPAH